MSPIYREIHRWARTPFQWGQSDCMLVLCDWIEQVRGVDPAAEVRGTYASRHGCLRETGWPRDPVGVTDRFLSAAGLVRVSEPAAGDVAVVRRADTGEAVGALWTGSAWACKGPSGATTLRPALCVVLAVWAVGYAAP